MHFYLNHRYVIITLLTLLSIVVGTLWGFVYILIVQHNSSIIGPTGTWTLGIFSAVAGVYYFAIDRKKDMHIRFKDAYRNEKHIFCLQAFNDSKLGNVILPQRFYISPKRIGYDKIKKDYRNHTDSLPHFNVDKKLDASNLESYYSVAPYDITPEITIPYDKFLQQVAYAIKKYKLSGGKPQDTWYLHILFSDINDNPYIFDFLIDDEESIATINHYLK